MNSFVRMAELNNWHYENRTGDPCSRSTMDYNGLQFFVRPPWQPQNGLSVDVPQNRGDPNYIQVLG